MEKRLIMRVEFVITTGYAKELELR